MSIIVPPEVFERIGRDSALGRGHSAKTRRVPSAERRVPVLLPLLAAVAATALLLPREASERAAFASGTLTVLGGALVLAILSPAVPMLWPIRAVGRLREAALARPAGSVLAIMVASCATYVVIARVVFGATPLNLDEIAQLYQARIFLEGRLWRAVAPHPEFFSIYHIVDVTDRVYGQFPPGGPAMLALGEAFGAAWLIGPLCAMVAVGAWAIALRRLEPRVLTRLLALVLFAFAPFLAFLAGTTMNHVPALMWLMLGVAALASSTRDDASHWPSALAGGFAFGAAATIRPADALAFALPAGAWYVARVVRRRARWRELVAAGVGIAIPLALLLWVNARTTGAPLLFGYEVLWGKAHGIGFHVDPSGVMHTPARGLSLVAGYLRALQSHLFETPLPALLAPFLALALTRTLRPLDRYLVASATLLVALYAAYWFDGEYLGPRFFLPLVPVLTLWTARLPRLVRERVSSGLALRLTVHAYIVAGAIALGVLIPVRAATYAAASPEMRWDADSASAANGVSNAVVLVRESWGSQVIARMHALGISRPDASFIYRRSDTCLLDERLRELEAAGVRGDRARVELQPLLADSGRLVRSPFSPRTAERVLPGATYTTRCLERIAEDRQGFTSLVPLTLARHNLYARDLHERNALLLAQHPGRPVYLLAPTSERPGAPLVFRPLSRDSLLREGHR
jgi:hypothetical protein